jgi:hypothetical protein
LPERESGRATNLIGCVESSTVGSRTSIIA